MTRKFDSSVTHKSNVCGRQTELYAGNVTLGEALKGLNLSVVLPNYQTDANKPFFTLNDDGVIDPYNPGLYAIIMDELARRAQFSWRNSYGVVPPLDSDTDGNKTWSDLLQWSVETFDIAANKWDRSIARLSRDIAFPEGWYDSSMIVVHIDDSKGRVNLWSIFAPLDWGVWLLLAITVALSGAAYWLLERLDTTADARRLEDHPGEAVYFTAIAFTGHFELRPQTLPARILTFSMTFIALIIAAVYTANLASFMVARQASPFTIDSIEQAVLLRAPICLQEKTNIDDYVSAKYPKAVLRRRENIDDVHKTLKSGRCSIAVMSVSEYEQLTRSSQANEDCTLSWTGKVENIIPAGFATDVDSGIMCTSLIAHVLDLHLVEMKADGFIDREWEAYLERTGDHVCVDLSLVMEDESENLYSLSVSDLAGIFIIHATLMGLAISLAVLHNCRSRLGQASKQSGSFASTSSSSDKNATGGEQSVPPVLVASQSIEVLAQSQTFGSRKSP